MGTLTALGIHITDYFQSIAGPAAEVKAIADHRSPSFDAEDVVTVQLRFESGATGTVTNLASTPFYSRISIFGDRSWVEAREWSNVDVPEPALLIWQDPDREIRTRTSAPSNTVRANVEAWARAASGVGTYRFSSSQLVTTSRSSKRSSAPSQTERRKSFLTRRIPPTPECYRQRRVQLVTNRRRVQP